MLWGVQLTMPPHLLVLLQQVTFCMQFLNPVLLTNVHYWKINKSPRHITGFTRLGNSTLLVSQKKLTLKLRKEADQNQHYPDEDSDTRRLVVPSTATEFYWK